VQRGSQVIIRNSGHGLIASPKKEIKPITFRDCLPIVLTILMLVGLTLLATSKYVWGDL
jgi:hypothetical protein